ncbi:MAG TPA: CHAT domain-containing protein, partial [Allocoleopsis sp.]
VAERARGRALQDLMQDRERRHPQLLDPKATPPEPNAFDGLPVAQNPGNMVMQMAMGVPVMPFDPTIQAAPAVSPAHLISTDGSIAASELYPAAPFLARLVFYCLTDRTAIFAVTPEGKVQGHVVPIGDDAIADHVVRLRHALQVDEVSRGMEWRKLVAVDQVEPVDFPIIQLETLLQDLYQDFVAPIADHLPSNGTPVVIEPHCSLWLMPFAAFLLPDDTWMGDRWTLIYAPSAQTLEEIRQEPCYAPLNQAKLLAVGNPIMPKLHLQDGTEIQLSPLPGAEAEVEAIAQLFPESQHTLLIQHEATEANVKAMALSHNIVHLATHGIAYGSDPLASLVAFSPTDQENGLLTAREVIRSAALPADLVVLSACQTGLGQITGEGMLGLSRA